jgi:hypothetical protein
MTSLSAILTTINPCSIVPYPNPLVTSPGAPPNRLLNWSTGHARLRLIVHQSPLVVGEDRDDVFRVWSEGEVVELDVAEMERALDLATWFLLPLVVIPHTIDICTGSDARPTDVEDELVVHTRDRKRRAVGRPLNPRDGVSVLRFAKLR